MTRATPKHRGGQWLRWFLGVLVAAGLWWLVGRSGEVTSVRAALTSVRWEWLALAGAVSVGSLCLAALSYRCAFAAVGIVTRLREVFPTLLAALAVGELAPFGWVAGSAVFLRLATPQGQELSRATVGVLLAQAADLLAFSTLFALGMLALLLGNHALVPAVLVGGGLLLALNIAFIGALLLAVQRPQALTGFGELLVRLVGGVAGAVAGESAQTAVGKALTGLVTAGEAVRESPKHIRGLTVAALGANSAMALCLFLVCVAFQQQVSLGQLLMGYGMGTLAWTVSPLPAGVGVVEGTMALAFATLGIVPTRAAVIAVAYRAMSFWLPFAVGLIVLSLQKKRDRALSSDRAEEK